MVEWVTQAWKETSDENIDRSIQFFALFNPLKALRVFMMVGWKRYEKRFLEKSFLRQEFVSTNLSMWIYTYIYLAIDKLIPTLY